MGTRERIVAAATEMIREGAERVSVRAVAARAGVGASTLRHYFPTQRDLLGATLTATYEESMPDDRIRDATVPPRVRLRENLHRLLQPFDDPDAARDVWQRIFDAFAAPDATPEARAGYDVLWRQAEQRVAAWLAILEAEGSLPPGDVAGRTQLLLTVVDGLSVARALPRRDSYVQDETAILTRTVDAVFDLPLPGR